MVSTVPRIVNSPNPDAKPETEIAMLASIYRTAVERYEEAKAVGETSGGQSQPEADNPRKRLA